MHTLEALTIAVTVCIASHAAGARAQALGRVISNPAYTHPQQLVDVSNGRKLNLYCEGTSAPGKPTVVFESGTSYPNVVWANVQPEIAREVRTCSYDRAGMGFSDPSARPSTAANAVDDLHRLLEADSIAPPYVLVGHSFGGAIVRLFADRYPSEVIGMVLVDPSHEDQVARFEAAIGVPDREGPIRLDRQRACAEAAQKGFVPGSELFTRCIRPPSPMFSPEINAALTKMQMRAAYQQAGVSEFENLWNGVSADQVRATRRSFGAMPLIVLTRGEDPRLVPNHVTAREEAWWKMHDELAHLSTRGVNRAAPGSGHDIMLERPDTVIAAINDVLATLRSMR